MYLSIISNDQNIITNIICKNNGKFIDLEEKIYKDYPEYFNLIYSFSIKWKMIDKNKNLDANKINNNDIIIINIKFYILALFDLILYIFIFININ